MEFKLKYGEFKGKLVVKNNKVKVTGDDLILVLVTPILKEKLTIAFGQAIESKVDDKGIMVVDTLETFQGVKNGQKNFVYGVIKELEDSNFIVEV